MVSAGPFILEGFVVAGNEKAGVEFLYLPNGVPFSEETGFVVKNSFILAQVNPETEDDADTISASSHTLLGLVTPFQSGLLVKDNAFYGFAT